MSVKFERYNFFTLLKWLALLVQSISGKNSWWNLSVSESAKKWKPFAVLGGSRLEVRTHPVRFSVGLPSKSEMTTSWCSIRFSNVLHRWNPWVGEATRFPRTSVTSGCTKTELWKKWNLRKLLTQWKFCQLNEKNIYLTAHKGHTK